jgi:DNA end-binding protein Ku
MASTVWKGYFSFGLISVPIRLYVAARESHVSFHQVHEVCGTRVKQQLFCPHCERVVQRSELVKAYPVDKDHLVTVTEEELRSLEAESSETMEIVQFVKLAEVDPLFFQTSYFTVAETAGQRAYALIFEGMAHLGLGAIAKITLHQREQIVMLRPYDKGLVLHTLYYPEEVREVSEYGNQPEIKVQKAEVDLAEQFMHQLTANFDASQFKDEYQARVEQLVESKEEGTLKPVEHTEPKHKAQVINLMDALKKSMEQHAGRAAEETTKSSARESVSTEAAPAAHSKTLQMPSKKAPQKASSAGRKKRAV